MSNTITVNMENLTTEEREQLLKIVEKSQTEKKWWEGTVFDVKVGEKYFHVGNAGSSLVSIAEQEMIVTDARLHFGNACKDEAYIERRAKEIKLYNLLSNFAEVVNDGWAPDRYNSDMLKYVVTWNATKGGWEVTYGWTGLSISNIVFFKSPELAQRAIDEIIIPFEKGEL